jgi:cyclopropane-fatty-acyl-phospholipid synthase
MINGPNSWDPQIKSGHEVKVFLRLITQGSIGAGETYTEGLWWTNEEAALEEFLFRITQGDERYVGLSELLYRVRARFTNLQRGREKVVGRTHYDLFSEIHPHVLGETGQYSCGWFGDGEQTLDEAQRAKRRRIAKKLKLEPGMLVLDIGCGWGYLAKYLAETCGVRVVGVTVSHKQAVSARARCKGLLVEILEMPFEQLPAEYDGVFDRIVSVGMFEHVGTDNYVSFFAKARRVLKPSGIFLLHTITSIWSKRYTNGWLNKYIFPNGVLPSEIQIAHATEHLFVTRHQEDLGLYYPPTLRAWYHNFTANWPAIQAIPDGEYTEEFRRMTVFYLLASTVGFRRGRHQVLQKVLTPIGPPPTEYTLDV